MRRPVFVLSTMLAFCTTVRAQLPENAVDWLYLGRLGESTEIGMCLHKKGKIVEGFYFYRKDLVDVALRGEFAGVRDIVLVEADPVGKKKGRFHLHVKEHDPSFGNAETLKGELLEGSWESLGAESYPVYLQAQHGCAINGEPEYRVAGAQDDALVEKNVQAFYAAVTSGRPKDAAQYVSYPCTYFRDGKSSELKTQGDFLENYSAIFVPSFVKRIANGIPHHMFANWQGIMIANGAVWFDEEGKAKHFNNQ